jgi:hypothetical protein
MSKDLLKEAIADAKAVRETAIANAKLALEEAFTPKLQSMLSTKIREDFEDEEEVEDDVVAVDDAVEDEVEDVPVEEPAVDAEEAYEEDVEVDLGLEDEEEVPPTDESVDLELEAILRELEGEEEEETEEPAPTVENADEDEDEKADLMNNPVEGAEEAEKDDEDFNFEQVINSLREEDEEEEEAEPTPTVEQADLDEAYATIKFLRSKINEVNLLNAKLLFSNKLFRANNLNENQKLRIIETFDRAVSVREVKLVYSTLAESMSSSKAAKSSIAEGLASKATKSTAPKKGVIVESNDFSDRMRKLAGLI